MAIEFFKIEWSKLYPIEEAQNSQEIIEGGVYAKYRRKGNSYTLHYIGRSKDFSKRTPYHRLATVQNIPKEDRKKYFISFGIISSFERSTMTPGCSDTQRRMIENFLRSYCPTDGNDPSTRKSYVGSAILIANTGKVIKPLTKLMSHNKHLLGELNQTANKHKKASSSYDY